MLARTWRLEIIGDRNVEHLRHPEAPLIYAVWHGQFLAPLWHRRRRGIALLVSTHADGRLVAHAAARWGYRVVSGSTTRGGVSGLLAIVRALRGGAEAALTPDGPKGPGGTVKPGVAAAAQLSGAAIVPVAAHASSEWRARSWDRMSVPRPFARVRIVSGSPFRVGCGTEARDRATKRLERELARAEALARCGE
jgi:lysophospholipid acyltransferase (LPLAT)-like uncharacterized protein